MTLKSIGLYLGFLLFKKALYFKIYISFIEFWIYNIIGFKE